MSNDATHLAAQQQERATAPLPHIRRDTSVTLFPASHPCFSPLLMNLKLVCFCDAGLMRPLSIFVNLCCRPVSLAGLKLATCHLHAGGSATASRKKETVAGWADGTTFCVTLESFDCDCGTWSQTFLSPVSWTAGPLASGLRDMQPHAHGKEIRGQTTTQMGHV